MIAKILYALTANLPCKLINVDHMPYLERYYLGKVFGVTLFIHRFIRPDGDREVHNHPWGRSVSIILCGGYEEERVDAIDVERGWVYHIRTKYPLMINVIKANTFHRIASIKPETWTLFMHGKRIAKWGFLKRVDNGVMFHQPYQTSELETWDMCPRGKDVGRIPCYE